MLTGQKSGDEFLNQDVCVTNKWNRIPQTNSNSDIPSPSKRYYHNNKFKTRYNLIFFGRDSKVKPCFENSKQQCTSLRCVRIVIGKYNPIRTGRGLYNPIRID